MFDSLARLVPDDLQAAYYRVLAQATRTPSVQTMKCCASWRQWAPWHCSLGTLPKTLQTRESIFRSCLNFIEKQFSDEAQRNMSNYVRELESANF